MNTKNYPKKVRKRDGSIVNFDASKIRHAIERAALETVGDKKKTELKLVTILRRGNT